MMDRMKAATSFGSPGRSAAGCVSRILRRILCFSGLPLCSFDHFKVDERESEVVVGAPDATPGVVARLMGLDSLPLPSSRHIPDYQELHDDNFFILSFENRRRSRTRKKSSRIQHSVEDRSRKEKSGRGERSEGKNKENEEPVNLDSIENRGNVLALLNNSGKKSEKITTKRAKQDCFGIEDESENSSPNSVLEFMRFSADQESGSLGEVSRLTNSKMRRPLSDELDTCGDSTAKVMCDGLDQKGGNLVKSKQRDRNFEEKLDEVGKLAATETMRSSWLHDEIWRNKHWFMEIGREIASNVFDHLLEDLLIDLEVTTILTRDTLYL